MSSLKIFSQMEILYQQLEQEWCCPISKSPMIDPVSTVDGHTYERSQIMKWFQTSKKSPKTNLMLSSTSLISNIALKNLRLKFISKLPPVIKQLKLYQNQLFHKNIELECANQKIVELNQLFQINKSVEIKLQEQESQENNQQSIISQTSDKLMQLSLELKQQNQKLYELQQLESTAKNNLKQVGLNLAQKQYQNVSLLIMIQNLTNKVDELNNKAEKNKKYFVQQKKKLTEKIEFLKIQLENANLQEGKHLTQIGYLYFLLKKYDHAISFLLKAQTIYTSTKQKQKWELSKCLTLLGNVYDEKKQYKTSVEYHLQSLEVHKSIYKKQSINSAHILLNLGNVYIKLGDYQEAQTILLNCLKLNQQTNGQNSLDCANIECSLGHLYYCLNDQKKSLQYIKKSEQRYKQFKGQAQVDTSKLNYYYTLTLLKIGKKKKALLIINNAISIRKNIIAPYDPLMIQFIKLRKKLETDQTQPFDEISKQNQTNKMNNNHEAHIKNQKKQNLSQLKYPF